jgi:uncharacterized coiled-coil protein SlyX
MRRLVATILLLLSACAFAGGGDTALEGATSEPPEFARGSEAPAAEEGQVAGEPQAASDTAAVEVAFLQANRQIVYVADMTVATDDVRQAARQAAAVVEAEGGFLFAEDSRNEPHPEAVLTFKVPPDRFRAVIDRLGELGELRSLQISADDVTERVVDLESRIRTTEASIARLRSLLAEATDIEGIVELERELAEREANLEVLRGELRTLSERVAMATLTLRLVQARADASLAGTITAYAGHDGGVACPGREQALSLERREPVTVCWEITNTGDTHLIDLRLTDPALQVELADLIVVAGDPDRPLAPGDTLILAHETTGERRTRLRTTVEATPATEDGNPIQGMTPTELQMTYTLDFSDPPGPPTFTDGLEASWELLLDLGGFGLAAIGAALPFLWVVPLAWWGFRTIRRRPGKAESG